MSFTSAKCSIWLSVLFTSAIVTDITGMRFSSPWRSRTLQIAALHVLGVEQHERALVELVDDVLRHDLRARRRHDHHEVVAADVADEVVLAAELLDRAAQDVGQKADDLVALLVAVVVVEALEIVDVDVEKRERLLLR